ncbi:hypothetical protein [Enterococcus wangshanyuanii]|uniref:Uncharacterized protein n=1 Tax=Enterococcus wangshanyuanii TaxID=2005703 RepID=A0ABQ1PP60_9ENTE|nr:hypothetical protein [Enterococcus wangshanyuanii]GGD00637.1 hypothetical protein GCM10011573_32780 [Enterococcus wangshanyuanii]
MKRKYSGIAVLVFSLQFFFPTAQALAKSESVTVYYYNTKDIADPDKPTNPEYVISVPSELNFTKEKRRIDATVSMNNLKGGRYTGTKTAKVTVTSKNKYALAHTDNFAEISYSLIKYDASNVGSTITTTQSEIGVFDKTNPIVKSEAILGATTVAKKNMGTYTDVLTYTVKNL